MNQLFETLFNGLDTHPTKVECDNPKMHRWKAWKPQTPFAPDFDIPIYIDSIDVSGLLELIQREKIVERFWTTYNIFHYDDLLLKVLADNIYKTYIDYMKELDYDPLPKDKLWIRGWANAFAPETYLKHHAHAFHENSYLSSNVFLSGLNTSTDYLFPFIGWYFGYWKDANAPGKISMFPSWLEHMVNVNTTKEVRFSLGFDMFTEESFSYIRKNRNENSETQNILLMSKLFSEI